MIIMYSHSFPQPSTFTSTLSYQPIHLRLVSLYRLRLGKSARGLAFRLKNILTVSKVKINSRAFSSYQA